MSAICCVCGKKYKKSLSRSRWVSDGGQFGCEPICKKCWSGTVVVDGDESDYWVCADCNNSECVVSQELSQSWKDEVETRIKADYPHANVTFVAGSEIGTYYAANYDPDGIIRCPSRYLEDIDVSGDYTSNCDDGVAEEKSQEAATIRYLEDRINVEKEKGGDASAWEKSLTNYKRQT